MKNLYTLSGSTAVILIFTLLFSSCGQNQGQIKDELIKIGFISPQTGTAVLYGIPALNSARVAIDEINAAGGILGRQVELVVEDGKCEGKAATNAAQKLIQTDNVKFLLAGHCSTESMTVAPIANKNRVFMMAQLTSTPEFPLIDYVYRTSPSSNYYMGKTADVAYERGFRKIGILVEQLDFPQGVANSFSNRFAELGGKIVGRQDFAPKSKDFRTELIKLKSLNADAFFIESQGPDSASIILRQLQELGINLQLIGGPLFVSEGTYEKSEGLLPENAFGVTTYADPNTTKMKAFIEEMKTRYDGVGYHLAYIAGVYDNVQIIKQAIEACNNDDPICANSYFRSLNSFDGLIGTIVFDKDKNPFIPLAISTIKNGKMHYEPVK